MSSEQRIYETVGAVDRSVAETLAPSGDTILIDDGDEEYLIAQPKGGRDRDE